GMIEQVVCQGYHLSEVPIQIIMNDTGVPAGWYPLVTGYEVQPALPSALDLPALPQKLFNYLARHERINPDNQELNRIRANLCALYEAGPGAKNVEQEEAEET